MSAAHGNGTNGADNPYDDPALTALVAHMAALRAPDPPPLDPELFDALRQRITPTNVGPLYTAVFSGLSAVLQLPDVVHGGAGMLTNTEAVCRLAIAFVESPVFSFESALCATTPAQLEAILVPNDAPAINKLALAVLGKVVQARTHPSVCENIRRLVALEGVFRNFVVCWLETGDLGVAEQCERLLVRLLLNDRHPSNYAWPPPPREALGQMLSDSAEEAAMNSHARDSSYGRLWDLFLGNPDVYDILLAKVHGHRADRSIGLSRILKVVPLLSYLDLGRMSGEMDGHRDADPARPTGGLLHAALSVADHDDPAMLACQVDAVHALVVTTAAFVEYSRLRTGFSSVFDEDVQTDDPREALEDKAIFIFQARRIEASILSAAKVNGQLVAKLSKLLEQTVDAVGETSPADAENLRIWIELVVPRKLVHEISPSIRLKWPLE